ncbi:MAG: hypothetical protein Kow00105_02400 [Phycisphaeraceae bacterium]
MTSGAGAVLAVLIAVSPVRSATWNNPAGGNFQDSSNWGGGTVPGPTGNALFDVNTGTPYTVSFLNNVTNEYLIVGRDDVTFDLNGFTYDLTRTTPSSIILGELAFDNAVLTVTDGTLSGLDMTIGQLSGGSGTLNVPTSGTVSVLYELEVGDEGTGAVNITGGQLNTPGAVIANIPGSTGDVMLTGTTSLWTNTNSISMMHGNSTLTVQNGAVLNTNNLDVATDFTAIADVTLEGPGSQINITNNLSLSTFGGTSTMAVRSGATLSTGEARIGYLGVGADATFLITDPGTTWVSSGQIFAGYRGDAPGGVLRIENGAQVSSVSGAIGFLSDSQGEAIIDGAGSSWTMTGDLNVGDGAANLIITNGGLVSNANAVIGTGGSRPISITVDGPGSLWDNAGTISGGVSSTMTITNGGRVNADSVTTSLSFTLDGSGSRWDITNSASFSGATTSTSTISNNALLTSNGGSLTSINLDITNGGTWNNLGPLSYNATASASSSVIRVSNGGVLINADASLVTLSGRYANVIVEDPGSTWESYGLLTIGGAGDDGSGNGGLATLTIRNGANVYATAAAAATVATGRADILMEGSGTRWDVDGDLILGGSDLTTPGGIANATVVSEALLDVTGTLKIHPGSNLTLLGGHVRVGDSTQLIVDQSDGLNFTFGTVEFTGNATFGYSDIQTLLGSVPTLGTAQQIRVGGTATLNSSLIIDGGTFSVGQLQGSNSPLFLNGRLELTNDNLTLGLGTMFGPNLTLQSNRSLLVGNTLTVNAGSLLTVDQTTLTAGALVNDGEVVINGVSALINGGTMSNSGILTGNGRIDLLLTNAATGVVRVNAGNHLIVERQADNNGRIDLTGGTLEVINLLQNNAGATVIGSGTLISRTQIINDGEMVFSGPTNVVGDTINNAAGLIVVSGGGPITFFDDLTQNGELRTSAGSTSVFLGTVSGSGTFTGSGTTRFEGDFTPGASPADITFSGDVEFTESANLEIELLSTGGVPGTDFDRLNINGLVSLAGTLSISLLGGYTPGPGDSFQILVAGARTGTFDSIVGADLGGGLMFDVVYGSNDVTLAVIGSSLDGDLNGDGFVGIADLNIVLSNWNQSVPPGDPLADANGDGFVGIADLNQVLGNWNAGTPPATNGIPEPASFIMLGLGALLVNRRPYA